MKILFVCASNICRSPYCEFLFKRMMQEDEKLAACVEKVSSAAVFNRSFKIHPKARIALKRENFTDEQIDTHKPRYIFSAYKDFKEADLIIGMENFNKHFTPFWFRKKYKSLSEVAEGKYVRVEDPFLMKNMEDYFKVMDTIKDYLEKFKKNIIDGKVN